MSLSRQLTTSLRASRTRLASLALLSRAVAVRGFAKTALVREDGYDKHRVQVKEPSAGTTDDSMKMPYVEPEVGKEQEVKPRKTLSAFSMQGKVCVITGGARGIGHMISQAFMESQVPPHPRKKKKDNGVLTGWGFRCRGATQVAILDLKREDAEQAGKEMVAKFEESGEFGKGELEVVPVGCDVSSEESVRDAFAEIKARFGRIDCVVNSAGLVENFPATEYPTAKVKKLIDVNILGSYFVAREAAKVMQSGASIILIGSMSGVVINVPQPQTPYNFSKAAVIHMAKSLAVEWAPKGIRVNCISPGYVLTNLTKVILDANTELRDTWTNMTPMGRLANPDDLKGAVIYLGSDASAFTTGSNMIVDGGYTCL